MLNCKISPSLTVVLPSKTGGVLTFMRSLLAHTSPLFVKHAILTSNTGEVPSTISVPAEQIVEFRHEYPPDNLHRVLSRLSASVPRGPGVLVANDWLELAMLAVHDPGKLVVNVTHGDFPYYYDLAVHHEDVIDYFVAVSDRIAEQLRSRLRRKADRVFRISPGVDFPAVRRSTGRSSLRALFVGRLDRNKGVMDLPLIDRKLRERGVHLNWTVVGAGPEDSFLREAWSWSPSVVFTGELPSDLVAQNYRASDILILPTKAEGLPITLLEAGSHGVVPIVTDLPSGIPEVVHDGVTGYRIKPGYIAGFIDALVELESSPEKLEQMSIAIRQLILDKFTATKAASSFERLFDRYQERPRFSRSCSLRYGGRLDQTWIPNFIVRRLRTLYGWCR